MPSGSTCIAPHPTASPSVHTTTGAERPCSHSSWTSLGSRSSWRNCRPAVIHVYSRWLWRHVQHRTFQLWNFMIRTRSDNFKPTSPTLIEDVSLGPIHVTSSRVRTSTKTYLRGRNATVISDVWGAKFTHNRRWGYFLCFVCVPLGVRWIQKPSNYWRVVDQLIFTIALSMRQSYQKWNIEYISIAHNQIQLLTLIAINKLSAIDVSQPQTIVYNWGNAPISLLPLCHTKQVDVLQNERLYRHPSSKEQHFINAFLHITKGVDTGKSMLYRFHPVGMIDAQVKRKTHFITKTINCWFGE